jgi:excisionase family DNA binding protein
MATTAEAPQSSDSITLREAAQIMGIHIETMREFARRGKIKGFKLGEASHWRISRADVYRFMRERSNQPAGAQ